jgi:hypothetical protein
VRNYLVLLTPLALLAACAPTDTRPVDTAGPDLSTCGGTPQSSAIGHYLVAGTAGPNEVNEDDLPPNTRVLRPTDPMTRDFRPDRLTVFIDETGRILRLQCV